MSKPRRRNRDIGGEIGVLKNHDSSIYSESKWQRVTELCEDVTEGWRSANFLNIQKLLRAPELMSGSYSYFGIALEMSNYASTRAALDSAPHNMSGIPTDTIALGTALFARTNPGKAAIQLPVSIAELRDLPRMIKGIGDDFVPKLANGRVTGGSPSSTFLSWKFGWLPFAKDISTLMNIQTAIQKKMDAFEDVKEHGGHKRRINLSKGKLFSHGNVDLQTLLMVMSGERTSTTNHRTWGSIRWIPNGSFPRDNATQRKLAIRAALGLSSNSWSLASNAWNAMPWTWLFDWFGNMGDFLEAHNGAMPFVVGQACIMQSISTDVRLRVTSGRPTGVTGGGGFIRRTSKTRTPYAVPALTANVPILSGTQMTILAALVNQRFPLASKRLSLGTDISFARGVDTD